MTTKKKKSRKNGDSSISTLVMVVRGEPDGPLNKKKELDLLFCCATINTSKQTTENKDHIMKAFNFGSRFYFLAGAASVAALSSGSVVGCCAILALVVIAYKF